MREINLTQGKVAIVDDEDYEKLSKYKWGYNSYGYAKRNFTQKDGTRRQVYMHAFIIGKINGLEIDHINNNPLDNRRCNLRHVTHQENCINRKSLHRSSEYKGVYRNKNDKVWRSQITIRGKLYDLGGYESEKDAAWVYNVWAESFFGKYAKLNVLEI